MKQNDNRYGIISLGNWVIDAIKFIDVFPRKGNLTTITGMDEGLGGCAHNVLVDLAKLQSGIPLYAGGCIGNDGHGKMCLEACREHGIDSRYMYVLENESTSYTDVMTETSAGAARTFFHFRGANAKLSLEHVLGADTPARIIHLGYLLLLDELDKEDSEYGVVAARALDALQKKGYKTSVDVVSEESDRYARVVLPCLKYTDYLIVNEVEAGNITGRHLRDGEGHILEVEVKQAAKALLDAGVNALVVIHYPEGAVAASKDGEVVCVPSFSPDKKDIVSTVGAGDAFCAGALYAIHEGYDLKALLRFASACARFNLFSTTSTGGAPTLDTINHYLQNIR